MEKTIEQKYQELEYLQQKSLKVINKLKGKLADAECLLAENEIDLEQQNAAIKQLYGQLKEAQEKQGPEVIDPPKAVAKKNKEKKTK
jgi:uncharacterized coiled-coil protein SlyX